jgi:hypothetical protein
MAIVRAFRRSSTLSSGPHRTSVDCDWGIVATARGTLLQLNTYGSADRKIPGKVSQTLQFGRDEAVALRAAIDEAFGSGS